MMLFHKRYLFLLIILTGSFLRLYRLSDLMPFIADQGWYYISARDMILNGNIPLVGITSSHIWLHQGALWTYMLVPIFKIFNFNPVMPAYFIAILGIATIILVYKIAKEMFGERIALISAFLFATSPLIITDARFAYHTSPIPFFTALLLPCLYRWIKGDIRYFPLVIFILGILYNFEIATFSLIAISFFILLYGILKKRIWALKLFSKKIIVSSVIGFLIPMIPMLLYDLNHGFSQTIRVIIWIFYHLAVFIGYPSINPDAPGETWYTFFPFAFDLIQKLIFLPNFTISILILLISFGFLSFKIFNNYKIKNNESSYVLIFLLVIIPILSYIAAKANSSAYVLIFYPQVMIMIAIFFDKFIKERKSLIIVSIIIITIGVTNSYLVVKKDFLTGPPFTKRLNAAREIIKQANGKSYNIKGRGEGSIYESFITPHVYLTWWFGQGPSDKNEKLKFYVSEYIDRIVIEKGK